MIYQLPNGKIIRITLEEYLDLSDEEITYLVSLDCGESAANPWLGSSLPYNPKRFEIEDYEESSEVGDASFPFDAFDEGFDVPNDVDLD